MRPEISSGRLDQRVLLVTFTSKTPCFRCVTFAGMTGAVREPGGYGSVCQTGYGLPGFRLYSGALAQLAARLLGRQEAAGPNPASSTCVTTSRRAGRGLHWRSTDLAHNQATGRCHLLENELTEIQRHADWGCSSAW